MCRVTRTEPSLLLHPLDFMGAEDDDDLSFFPAMNMPLEKKLQLMDGFMDSLTKNFEPISMGDHIRCIQSENILRDRSPSFSH